MLRNINEDRNMIEIAKNDSTIQTEDIAEHYLIKSEEYKQIIKELEWSVIADFGNNLRCPMCKKLKTEGHKKDCKLNLALE
jgi:hypothetical protein